MAKISSGLGPIDPDAGYTMPMVAKMFGTTLTWVRREMAQKGGVPFTRGKILSCRATLGRFILTWIEENLDQWNDDTTADPTEGDDEEE